MTLKRLLRLTLVLSAALYVGCGETGNPETGGSAALTPSGEVAAFKPAADPKPVPATAFKGAGDREVTLADFKGKTVLLNFWATWCAPCKVEMPSLDRLQTQLGGDDFEVVTLSSDRAGKRAVDPYFAEAGLTALKPYYDPKNAVGMAMGVTGLPTTILIDAQGRELGRMLGDAEWDSPEAIALVKQAMGK
ncbi:TlpA disulfide reductase family protein [Iodidimonas sp. SYSU 1G8]|uniref:TlpA family protein disulfide reductase n=1 Tax=Iodidimonas sp. SYSU 1G8 TaxID=3133967 RepID=UPI0031FF1619